MTMALPLRTEPVTDRAGTAARPLCVLVVEDHLDTREMLSMLLELLGYEVVVAGSKSEALRAALGTRCDILLSDLGLADGTGWDLMNELGADRPPYAVAMSGYGMSTDLAKSKAAGFRHHLIKPLGQEQLLVCLQEATAEAAAA